MADAPGFAERTGRGVSIAVIDSGVHAEHPHIGTIAGGVAFTTDGEMHDDFVDRLGHGTAVTAAIQEKARDADVHIVKVFDDALATSVPTLVKAIDWASARGVHLVNLSLGTPNSHRAEVLGPAVERAVERGTLIVSAHEHDGSRWLPGSLPGVVGVVLDPECPRDRIRVRGVADGSPDDGVVGASGYPRPIPGVPEDRNLKGISFAVANVTGMLACAMQDGPRGVDAARAVSLLRELASQAR
jgi:hypothetical protein